MGSIEVERPVDYLDPLPKGPRLETDIESAAETTSLPFDPVKLKEKYLEERDRRLLDDGINQYRYVDGHLSGYRVDPWVKPGFTRDPVDEEVDVVVIGGGYGAQLCAVRLIEAGIKNIRIIEKAGDFGGTWYWNRYPGAQCDIESYIYMPLLEELNYMPTEKYAHASELLKHAEMIGKHWGLYELALFQTEAESLTWNDTTSTWTIHTNRNDTIRSQFVIPCAGPLHRPKLPGLPIENFRGHSFHSSRWDYNYTGGTNLGSLTNLADKRVAIIGTGATAIQIVPHLGASAKQLYVFQRTPSSIDVRGNHPTSPAWSSTLKPGWQSSRMENFNNIVNGLSEPTDLVDDGWTSSLHRLAARSALTSTLTPAEAAAQRQLADFQKMHEIRARASSIVTNPETAESLKPYYNWLCKRPCFHDQYLQTFNLPNVTLVDTHGQGVQDITPTAVVANNIPYEVDCIVYATGFELATSWSQRTGMTVSGRDGTDLATSWAKGAHTLHGWTTRGFPNCFWVSVVQAALTPNYLHVTGEQARHIAYVIARARDRGIKTVEPTQEAQDTWVRTIVEMAKIREPFLKECTPGYYNNEGTKMEVGDGARLGSNASYAGGSPAFLEILREWREEGGMQGLDCVFEEGGGVGVGGKA